MPYIGKKPENIIATAIDSTTGDFSGNVTAGGTLGVTGIGTFTDDIIIGDGKTIGSASKTDAITIASSGLVQLTSTGIGAGSQVLQVIDDGATLFQIRSEDGNVSFPQAGAGIYLGVTSGNSANLLDDYEEGSHDVAMADGTSHSLTQNGSYTKIGRFVHFQAKVVFPNTGTDTTSTRLSLPFTVSSRTNYFASTVVGSNGSANAQICIGIGGTATLLLQNIDGSTSATNQHLSSANLNISLNYETT